MRACVHVKAGHRRRAIGCERPRRYYRWTETRLTIRRPSVLWAEISALLGRQALASGGVNSSSGTKATSPAPRAGIGVVVWRRRASSTRVTCTFWTGCFDKFVMTSARPSSAASNDSDASSNWRGLVDEAGMGDESRGSAEAACTECLLERKDTATTASAKPPAITARRHASVPRARFLAECIFP